MLSFFNFFFDILMDFISFIVFFNVQVQIRFSGKGEKMNLLPIRDLRLSEGEKQQETSFTAEIGPLCFL